MQHWLKFYHLLITDICVQHLYCNFKKLHRRKALKDMLWRIVRSSNLQLYEAAMKDLEEYDVAAFTWVKKGPILNQWRRAFFSDHVKSDMLCNNLSESFKAFILEARDKPIISLMEGIRVLIMQKIEGRRSWILKLPESGCCPRIRDLVEKNVVDSRVWKPIWNGLDGYRVKRTRKSQLLWT